MRRSRRQRGNALITTFGLTAIMAIGAVSYVDRTTSTMREARRQTFNVQATHLCEAGVQSVLRSLWRPFKQTQRFSDLEDRTCGASTESPLAGLGGTIPGVGSYSAAVVAMWQPSGDTYTRIVVVRSVGWVDSNQNGTLDPGEPQKVVDVTATFQLARSQVFDYSYFVNNYGWMDGFNANELYVNGDMRANGDFNYMNGLPTINGSIFASMNEKLTPAAAGLVNNPPVKWTNSTYTTERNKVPTNVLDNQARWRPAYNSAQHGAIGTSTFEQWRDLVYESAGQIQTNRLFGATVGDARGLRGWNRTTESGTLTTTVLDTNPTEEVIMPDLSDLSYYTNLSETWTNPRMTYQDGTADPNAGTGAYLEVWNSTLGAYQRLTTNGVVTGSAVLVGTDANPIRINGPITVTQDILIKGTIAGQGTIYTGRNVHVVGSVRYKNKPDFRGSNPTTIDQNVEKSDMLGLAARGSIIMGDTTKFTATYPLKYMTPPFTKGRYDDSGTWIPPFDARQVDSSGKMRYQTVVGDTTMTSIAEGVNQIDAVLYTNFVGGGNVGTGGGGAIFNGSIISRDEAMVMYSLPMRMNYDTRVRERSLNQRPLIDLQLPRSPVMLRSTWQDRGFSFGSY